MNNAVIGILFRNNYKEVLALRRRDVDVWVFPGGGIDKEETPEAAVIREVFEETGLRVSIKRKIGEYTPINRLSRQTAVFECTIIDGKPSTGPETRAIDFFPVDHLPYLFFPLHQDWLDDALLQEPQVICKPILQITYGKLFKFFCRHPVRFIRFVLSRLGFPLNSH